MNTTPQSSIASGTKFSQSMVDQTPKYDRKMFRRKLRRGRPSPKHPRQYWIK